jgi:hypothetical protein
MSRNPLITTNLKVRLKAVKRTMSDRYRWRGFTPTFKGRTRATGRPAKTDAARRRKIEARSQQRYPWKMELRMPALLV